MTPLKLAGQMWQMHASLGSGLGTELSNFDDNKLTELEVLLSYADNF